MVSRSSNLSEIISVKCVRKKVLEYFKHKWHIVDSNNHTINNNRDTSNYQNLHLPIICVHLE